MTSVTEAQYLAMALALCRRLHNPDQEHACDECDMYLDEMLEAAGLAGPSRSAQGDEA